MKMTRAKAAVFMLPLFFVVAVPVSGAPANDYPTQERVEYVINCMDKLGGTNYDNLYKCSCSIDEIADQFSYDDYLAMQTFDRGREAGGERPELIREGKMAGQYRRQYAEVRNSAAEQCGMELRFSER